MNELADAAKTRDHAQPRFSRREHWPLLLIFLLATALRLWQITESLWLDELHSAWVVSASLSDVAERAWIGNQSPLYFYLPWATTSVFGMHEWSLRLPSLIASLLLVVVAYRLVYEVTTSRVAACTTALAASFDTNFLFYATEVRPYACVQLVAVVQLYSFLRLQSCASRWHRFAFILLSGSLFYLHYTAILLLGGEVAFTLLLAVAWRFGRKPAEYTLGKVAIDGCCILVLTLPLAAHLMDIGSRRGNWASFVRDTSLTLSFDWFSLDAYVVVPATVCLVIAGVVGGIAVFFRDEGSQVSRKRWQKFTTGVSNAIEPTRRRCFAAGLIVVCWFVVPLTLVWISTVNDLARLYLLRYVVGVALAPMLIAGLCVGVCRDRRLQALVAIVTVVFGCYSSPIAQQWQYDGRLFGDRQENWRDAVTYVNDNWLDDEVVFVRSGLLEADLIDDDSAPLMREYCVAPIASIYQVDDRASQLRPLTTSHPGKLTSQDVARLQDSGEAWFIVNGSDATRQRCRQEVLRGFGKQFVRRAVVKEQSFGFVRVFLIEVVAN